MKNLQKLSKALLFAVLMVFALNAAANPTYTCTARNDTLLNDRTYQFDIYIYDGGSADALWLNNYQLSFKINNAAGIVILPTTTLTVAYVAGTSELGSFAPGGANIMTSGVNKFVRVNGPPPTSNGLLIPTTGLRVGTFRMTWNAAFLSGAPTFAWYNATPATTNVRCIMPPGPGPVPPSGVVPITDMLSHNFANWADPLFNTAVPAYVMTGGGAYCLGGGGLSVGIDVSGAGCMYRILQNGVQIAPKVAGTGAPLTWGPYTAIDNYSASSWRAATYITGTTPAPVAISTIDVPAAAGAITGTTPVIQGNVNVPYSVGTISGADTYVWTYTGTGMTIDLPGNTDAITADFDGTATGGNLSVKGHNICGDGASSPLFPIVVNTPCVAASAWNGSVDNDWFNAGNWSDGVPCAITDVTIPGGLANYPTISGPASCKNIHLLDGASILGNNLLTVVGTAMVDRFITGSWGGWPNPAPIADWHFVSTPVTGAQVGLFTGCLLNDWLENIQSWQPYIVPVTTLLDPGHGFEVAAPAPSATYTYAGTLNAGPYPVPVTQSGFPLPFDGWNLIGNPYPSAVLWTALPIAGVFPMSPSIWDPSIGNWALIAMGDNIIPATQGVFVQAMPGGGLVIFDEVARVHSNHPFYKNTPVETLTLNVTNDVNAFSDNTYVRFNAQATAGLDTQFDANKLPSAETAPMIYSVLPDNAHLAINTLTSVENNVIVPLGFNAGVDANYTINATGIESFDASTPIFLEDLLTGNTQNLMENSAYSFSATSSDDPNRFLLHFAPVGINEHNALGVNIYSYDKNIVVEVPANINGQIVVLNNLGQQILSKNIVPGSKNVIPVTVATGYYSVKVVSSDNVVTQKVFIR